LSSKAKAKALARYVPGDKRIVSDEILPGNEYKRALETTGNSAQHEECWHRIAGGAVELTLGNEFQLDYLLTK
jgi:hypothetical protein